MTDPVPPIINILYGSSEVWGQCWLCSFVVFFMISKLSFLYCLIILLHLVTSFSCTRSLLVPYAYVSIESVDLILLSSFKLNAILLISSVKTCLSFWIFTVCLILIYCFVRVLYDFLRQFDFFLDFLFYLKLSCF